MPPPTPRSKTCPPRPSSPAPDVRNWGLFALAVALIIGAMIAPHTTLLAFVCLLVFGAVGSPSAGACA